MRASTSDLRIRLLSFCTGIYNVISSCSAPPYRFGQANLPKESFTWSPIALSYATEVCEIIEDLDVLIIRMNRLPFHQEGHQTPQNFQQLARIITFSEKARLVALVLPITVQQWLWPTILTNTQSQQEFKGEGVRTSSTPLMYSQERR